MSASHTRANSSIRAIVRWLGMLTLSGLAVLAIALPLPDGDADWLHGAPRPEDAGRWQRLESISRERDAAWLDWHAVRGLARWRSSGAADDPAPVHFDASVPAPIVATLDSVITREWRALGASASAARAQVFVWADTASPAAGAATRFRRTAVRMIALPPAADPERCIVLVLVPTLVGASPGVVASPGQLLGPCGYMAAFGAPGAAMREWLARTGWHPAASSDWTGERDLLLDADGFYSLDADGAACAAKGGAACRRALALEGSASPSATDRWEDLVLHHERFDRLDRSTEPLLGVGRRSLADVRHQVGPERFAALWRTETDLPAAFGRALGEPVERWTARWLRDGAAVARERPTPAGTDVLWVVGVAVAAVAAARARERTRAPEG